MSPALEVEHLARRFGRTVAVDDLSLCIEAGEAVALFGPNGAGKTTFLRLCATLLRPSAGRVRVFGLDAAANGIAVRRRIAMLAHESYLYPDLTPLENLRFHARLFSVADAEKRVRFLIDRLGLVGWAHRPVRALSRGLLQRCALARVLLHEPAVLFLDEPFTGLDLEAQTTLVEVLAEAHRQGTTLLMSTHDLASGLTLCTSALVLVRGRLASYGAVDPTARDDFERRYRALVQPAAENPPLTKGGQGGF
jgi:heme exporter protein A